MEPKTSFANGMAAGLLSALLLANPIHAAAVPVSTSTVVKFPTPGMMWVCNNGVGVVWDPEASLPPATPVTLFLTPTAGDGEEPFEIAQAKLGDGRALFDLDCDALGIDASQPLLFTILIAAGEGEETEVFSESQHFIVSNLGLAWPIPGATVVSGSTVSIRWVSASDSEETSPGDFKVEVFGGNATGGVSSRPISVINPRVTVPAGGNFTFRLPRINTRLYPRAFLRVTVGDDVAVSGDFRVSTRRPTGSTTGSLPINGGVAPAGGAGVSITGSGDLPDPLLALKQGLLLPVGIQIGAPASPISGVVVSGAFGLDRLVNGVVGGALDKVNGVFNGAGQLVGGAVGGVGSIANGLTNGVGALATGNVLGESGHIVNGAVNAVGSVVGGVANAANSVVTGVASGVSKAVNGVLGGVSGGISGISAFPGTAVGGTGTAGSVSVNTPNLLSPLGAVGGNGSVSVNTSNLLSPLGTFNPFGGVVNGAGQLVGGVVGGAGSITSGLANVVGALATGNVLGAAGHIVNGAVNAVGNVVGGVANAASSVLTGGASAQFSTNSNRQASGIAQAGNVGVNFNTPNLFNPNNIAGWVARAATGVTNGLLGGTAQFAANGNGQAGNGNVQASFGPGTATVNFRA